MNCMPFSELRPDVQLVVLSEFSNHDEDSGVTDEEYGELLQKM